MRQDCTRYRIHRNNYSFFLRSEFVPMRDFTRSGVYRYVRVHEVVTEEMQADGHKRLALKYGSGVLGIGTKSKPKAVLFLVRSCTPRPADNRRKSVARYR